MPTAAPPVLNSDMTFPPPAAAAMFVSSRPITLAEGTRLCKFTHHDLFTGGNVSPWWALELPGPDGDPGIDAEIAAGRASGRPLAEFIRDRYAVMLNWNAMGLGQSGLLRLQRARLIKPVVGLHGVAREVGGVPAHPGARAAFAGGAQQVFIPNLTGAYVIGAGFNLLG